MSVRSHFVAAILCGFVLTALCVAPAAATTTPADMVAAAIKQVENHRDDGLRILDNDKAKWVRKISAAKPAERSKLLAQGKAEVNAHADSHKSRITNVEDTYVGKLQQNGGSAAQIAKVKNAAKSARQAVEGARKDALAAMQAAAGR